MNKKMRIGLTLLIVVILLMAFTIPGLARKAPTFSITYVFDDVDWENYYAQGSFELQTTSQVRSGVATVSWTPRANAKKGTMTFTNTGPEGSFSIQFTIPTKGADTCASGSFRTIESSGEYAGMRGTGRITMCLVNGDTFNGTLSGRTK